MHSSVVLFIFATAFLLVQCTLCCSKKHDVHNPKIIRNCFDKKVRYDIIRYMKNAKLGLRDTLVPLNPPTADKYEFEPTVVIVKRCGGHCPYPKSPMPMKTKNATFIVKLREKGKIRDEKCVEVEVEEHHSGCKCRCDRPKQSNPNQKWVANNCAYVCDNESDKSVCLKTYGMIWDEAQCKCQCTKKIMNCPSNYTWDRKECDCMPDEPKQPKSERRKYRVDRAAVDEIVHRNSNDENKETVDPQSLTTLT